MSDNVTKSVDRTLTSLPDPSEVRTNRVHDIKIGMRASPFATVALFVVSGALAGLVTSLPATVAPHIVVWLHLDQHWEWDLLVQDLHFVIAREYPGAMWGGALGGAMGGLLTALFAAYWKRAATPAGAALVWVTIFAVMGYVMTILLPGSSPDDPKIPAAWVGAFLLVAFYGAILGVFLRVLNRLLHGPLDVAAKPSGEL